MAMNRVKKITSQPHYNSSSNKENHDFTSLLLFSCISIEEIVVHQHLRHVF